MSGNVRARAKQRRAGAPAWMVGEPINGVGNYIFGRGNLKNTISNNELRSRTPLGNQMPGNNSNYISSTNQLGGVGQFRSQFSIGADGVNKNELEKQKRILSELEDQSEPESIKIINSEDLINHLMDSTHIYNMYNAFGQTPQSDPSLYLENDGDNLKIEDTYDINHDDLTQIQKDTAKYRYNNHLRSYPGLENEDFSIEIVSGSAKVITTVSKSNVTGNTAIWNEVYLVSNDVPYGAIAIDLTNSSDFQHIFSTYQNQMIATSNNSGTSFTTTTIDNTFWCIASNHNSSMLIAGSGDNKIYKSTNYGVSWEETAQPNLTQRPQSITLSHDGSKIVLLEEANSQYIHISNDGGDSWSTAQTEFNDLPNWNSCTASSDGNYCIAGSGVNDNLGKIWYSHNSGNSWSASNTDDGKWTSVACDSTGKHVIAANNNISDCIYKSSDYGATWERILLSPSLFWNVVASSPTGKTLAAAHTDISNTSGYIYCSLDSGVTWHQTNSPVTKWQRIILNDDIAIATQNSGISIHKLKIPEKGPFSQTLTIDVTNTYEGELYPPLHPAVWLFEGIDRIGTVSGINPSVNMRVGDTMKFNLLYTNDYQFAIIRCTTNPCRSDLIGANPIQTEDDGITNNLTTKEGIVSWTPIQSGNYMYVNYYKKPSRWKSNITVTEWNSNL